MPDGLAFEVAVQDDALHVVREHVCWNAEAFEAVNHPDEEVLLLGIREELDVAGTAMVAGHDKARTLEDFSSGAVCLVLASELFDEADYVYDYNDFLEYVRCLK